MTYFIVAIVMFMQPTQMESISVMQIPFNSIDQCKEYIVDNGLGLQNDVTAMYPNAKQFSLVCIDKPTIDKIIIDMKQNSIGKDI